jgi:hypothetical protein
MAAILGGRLWIVKLNQGLEADQKSPSKTGNVEGDISWRKPFTLTDFLTIH